MTDIVSKARRSELMTGIKNKDTKPEIIVRKALYHCGYRYRVNFKIEKVKPDVVLTKQKVAIFVHGCYWHRHAGCKLCYNPKTRIEFWNKKFSENTKRDKKVELKLQFQGWRIAVFWECATRNTKQFEVEINKLVSWIESDEQEFETVLVLPL
jgi:DNA mismatch endonuclease (patch repair protein)